MADRSKKPAEIRALAGVRAFPPLMIVLFHFSEGHHYSGLPWLDLLAARGDRLGAMTGQYFLRFVGRDGYVLSQDVIACLRDAGVEIAANPTSKRDRAAIQAVFNGWAEETGLSRVHLSRICAMSIGENRVAGEEVMDI